MAEASAPRRGRGRRPAATVRAEVLSAAGRLLLDEGIQAVTFERVASDAGASKTTLYKWWPSPGALAVEAYFTQSRPDLEFPDSGDLRADLVAQISSFVALLTEGGAARPVSQLIGAAQTDPALADAWRRDYAVPRRELALARLRAAQHSGELSPEADLDVMVDQLWGAFYHRMLVLMVPIEDLSIDYLVDSTLRGAGYRRQG